VTRWTIFLAAVFTIFSVSLTSKAAVRIQVSDLVAPDVAIPEASDIDAARPVLIVGARNGVFSGKLLVSSDEPVEGLKAVPSDLSSKGSTIPASAVRIRYGVGWEDRTGFGRPRGLDVLQDSPPDRYSLTSVWMTVTVPRDAAPGAYKGTVTVTAGQADPVAVAIELRVADWVLPSPGDHSSWMELAQSPDTLSLEYRVPLWSPEHWKLIEQSFDLIGHMGSRVVYVPLICHTNLGNAESMVRWKPRPASGDNGDAAPQYDFDFSVMDRYLDAAEKFMGRPKIVVFNVWDVYQQDRLLAKGKPRNLAPESDDEKGTATPAHSTGPVVTAVDSATGRSDPLTLPRFSDPKAVSLWKPLFAELRRRMAQCGLEKAMLLGMFTDAAPTREETAALDEISGGLLWVSHAHFNPGRAKNAPKAGYWTVHENLILTLNPAKGRTYGWREPDLRAAHFRSVELDRMPPSTARCLMELQITGKQRGIGYVGGDIWHVIRDKRGRRIGIVTDRYPQSYWRNLEMRSCLLAPGPDGPVATSRYENVREGIQECEARIYLERALTDDGLRARLGEALADRAQRLLDDRQHALWRDKGLTNEEIRTIGSTTSWIRELKFDQRTLIDRPKEGYLWFQSSGWQERSEQLYGLAAEVQRILAVE